MTAPRPLASKRVLVTRPRAQAAALADKLAGQGAVPIVFPMIEITPLDDYSRLDAALRQLDQYDWVIFTSANGVAAVWDRWDGAWPAALRIAAVGPATARALQSRGANAAFMPDEYVAEALATGLGDVAGQRMLLPHAELAREALADALRGRGATVDELAAYRTWPAAPDPQGLAELRRGVDAITLTSASAARNFARLAPAAPAVVACIGPVTAAAAREAGLAVRVVAAEYTLDGLVVALGDYFVHPDPTGFQNP